VLGRESWRERKRKKGVNRTEEEESVEGKLDWWVPHDVARTRGAQARGRLRTLYPPGESDHFPK
jgi:hypothetical protein